MNAKYPGLVNFEESDDHSGTSRVGNPIAY